MKLGGHRRGSRGFTIVETLIVLAVTGILFVSAVLLVGGKQNKTEFTVAINNAKQQIQQVINETQSGFAGGTIQCSAGQPPDLTTPGTGCIFMGKVIQFGLQSDNSQLSVYPIVGNRTYIDVNGSRKEVDALNVAWPVAVSANVTQVHLQNGLTVVKPQSDGAVGIITSLGSYSGANCNGYLCSGSQEFSLYKINGSQANDPGDPVVHISATAANHSGGFPSTPASSDVTVCLSSGTTNQSGRITIAADGSLAVTLKIFNSPDCT